MRYARASPTGDRGDELHEARVASQFPPKDQVIADRTLTESSSDGGVVFANVEPGTYVVRAHEDGVELGAVTVECRAGVLVHASPP